MKKPTILVFYHYYFPDDVVSAVHLGQLCEGLVQRGWDVTACPSNRSCRDEQRAYSRRETLNGVQIERVWRPRFKQSSALGRLLNSLWITSAWSLRALRPGPSPEAIIIGSDPVLSIVAAIAWRFVRPQTKIVHWCFDLFPEAAFADGLLDRTSMFARLLRHLLERAYRSCDSIADIGSCMGSLLDAYASRAQRLTLIPWALEEPPAPLGSAGPQRTSIFGEARLALMYSGTFGHAHCAEGILELAQALRASGGHVVFSTRGNRIEQLRQSLGPEHPNVTFVGFAPPHQLEQRLAAADVHLVTLREQWTGTVVPSKFFGALAIGRPVIFFGSPDCCIADWIRIHRVGWVFDRERASEIAEELASFAVDSAKMTLLAKHCYDTYQKFFSRTATLHLWDNHLRSLVGQEHSQSLLSLAAHIRSASQPESIEATRPTREPVPQ